MKRMLLGSTGLFPVLSLSTVALLTAAPAMAQNYTQLAEAEALNPHGDKIETVTVTAQRREQSAQDVGIALSVLTSGDLAKHHISTVNDLQYTVPSFEAVPAFGSGQPEFRLRGVGFDDYGSNNSSTVGIYVDEVAYPVPASTQGLLFDVARVEVLRGPQGTLYGRNTTGGAVNFVTNRPTDELAAGVTLDYGSHGEFKGEGYISGPLADGLKFRLAALTDQGGAWQKNRSTGDNLGDKDTAAFRGQLEWTPNNKINILLQANWGYDKSEPNGLYLFSDDSTLGLAADHKRSATGWGGSSAFASLTGIAQDEKPFHNSINQGVSLHATVDLGKVDLTSITSYNALHRREFNDWDASQYAYAGTYFNTKSGVLSQEFRFSSKTEGPLSWLAGIYYSNEKIDEHFISDFWDLWAFDTVTSYKQYVQSIAAFAQAEYRFSDQLKLIVGLRAEEENRKQKDYVTAEVIAVGGSPIDFSAPADKSLRSRPLTGKVSLEYKPQDNVLLYVSASKGVKSGGFTAYNVPASGAVSAFKPETLWAYEGGFKTSFADDTLQLNGSLFYYDYHDQQIQSAIYTTAYGAIGAIVNAEKSYIYGGELEAVWQPLPELHISQSFGYKTGKFDKFDNFLDIAASTAANTSVYKSQKGEKVGFPPVSYSGSVAYTFDFGAYNLQPEFNYSFHDQRKPLLLGSTYNIDAYWLANVSLTLTPKEGLWEVSLYGRNIFDQKYDLERNFFISGINIAAAGEPATVGVRLAYKY